MILSKSKEISNRKRKKARDPRKSRKGEQYDFKVFLYLWSLGKNNTTLGKRGRRKVRPLDIEIRGLQKNITRSLLIGKKVKEKL